MKDEAGQVADSQSEAQDKVSRATCVRCTTSLAERHAGSGSSQQVVGDLRWAAGRVYSSHAPPVWIRPVETISSKQWRVCAGRRTIFICRQNKSLASSATCSPPPCDYRADDDLVDFVLGHAFLTARSPERSLTSSPPPPLVLAVTHDVLWVDRSR
jgi:hypothetical protein